MKVKKLTVMVIDEANKGHRGVFDESGACVQGDESVRSVALELLAGNDAAPSADTSDASDATAAADKPLMPEPLSSTDVPAK